MRINIHLHIAYTGIVSPIITDRWCERLSHTFMSSYIKMPSLFFDSANKTISRSVNFLSASNIESNDLHKTSLFFSIQKVNLFWLNAHLHKYDSSDQYSTRLSLQ